MTRQTTDIFISGGGVAGLTAAAAFGTLGYKVVIVDPAPPVVEEKAEGADLRTTAFLQPARAFLDRAGLWKRLAPHATPLEIMRIVDAAAEPPVTRDFRSEDISDAPFGWNLPNWLLRREMVARLEELPNVDFRPGTGFAGLTTRTREALVTLTDGSRIAARLAIAADGRGSPLREAAGIGVSTTRYGQKAVTFAATHEASHGNVSTEVHRAGGPFTLVPLPDHDGRPCSAVVWMTDGAEARRLMALDEAAFEAEATARSAGVLGPLTLASRRLSWPIISQMAERLTAERVALVAEAAHVIPPIGAQGLNMSLADLAALCDLAEDPKLDLGSAEMLDRYAAARHGDIRLRVTGIDALNRASIAGLPVMQWARSYGIRALHDIGPIRRQLMQLGLGASRPSADRGPSS